MIEPLPIVGATQGQSAPVFNRIGIVGLGLIGGSLALAIKRYQPAAMVIGVDRKEIIERAIAAHAIDVGADDLGMVSGAELIVLAAPVDENVRLLGMLPELVPGEALVTDVGGTKRLIAEAARGLPARLTFVGGHPMAGAAVGGLEHARADLFVGRPWILDVTEHPAAARLVQLLNAIGATCAVIPADRHDHLVAFLSDLPQLTVSALMHVVGEAIGVEGLSYAGKGLHDTTRLASSPASVWKPVIASNADEVGRALDALIALLSRLRADAVQGETLAEVFESAQKWKATLDEKR